MDRIRAGIADVYADVNADDDEISWHFSGVASWTCPGCSLPVDSLANTPPRNSPADAFLSTRHRRNGIITVLVAVFATAILICISVCSALDAHVISRWSRLPEPRDPVGRVSADGRRGESVPGRMRRFKYADLSAATLNFSELRKLGAGGFGEVYKGMLTERGTGTVVAVKRIFQGSEEGLMHYISETVAISRLRRHYFVQVLGYCNERVNEFLIVYDYMANGSLDSHLYGQQKDKKLLDWNRRYTIACDLASALSYLHEQRAIHRDIKPRNILLDSNFDAKIGDFGLARLVDERRALARAAEAAGTLGYLDPEYLRTGIATAESDVFSFGVVCLEIACGRPVFDANETSLVPWVWNLYGSGRLLQGADANLGAAYNAEEMQRLMVAGLWCSRAGVTARPKMNEVVQILEHRAPLPHRCSLGRSLTKCFAVDLCFGPTLCRIAARKETEGKRI